jgi:putative oxidoreductase
MKRYEFIVPIGRILFSLIFITSGLKHFSAGTIAYGASKGVPFAEFFVPAAGALAVLGGISIAVGYKTRIGALMIIAFLLPVTFVMHNYWAIEDQQQASIQQVMFMKNISMLGGALIILFFGAGKYSLDTVKHIES